jgi:hypothetical protein
MSPASGFLTRLMRVREWVRPAKGPWVSAVIGGGQLRLVMAEEDAVLWHEVLPLNPAYLEGGVIAHPRAVAQAIRTALGRSPQPDVSTAVAALSGYHALSAVVDIPARRDFTPARIAPREARRLFAYRPESSTLNWYELPSPGEGLNRFLIVVTRRAAIQAMRSVFEAAGLRLRALDSAPLAAARAANLREGIVVCAESDGGDVVVLKEGTVGAVRSAFWGTDLVDADSLLARVSDLAERTVTAHNDASPAGPLSLDAPVLVCGAGGAMLGPRVAEYMGRPAGAFTPPLRIDEPEVPMAEIAVNLGMVLSGADR